MYHIIATNVRLKNFSPMLMICTAERNDLYYINFTRYFFSINVARLGELFSPTKIFGHMYIVCRSLNSVGGLHKVLSDAAVKRY